MRGHISIGTHDTKNDCARVANVAFGHRARDLLNVLRLAWDWDQSDTWQIDQGQIWASVRVYVEHNWVINDVGVCACYFVGQLNDSVSDLLEVGELLALQLL